MPKFEPAIAAERDGQLPCPSCPHAMHLPCVACGEEGPRDKVTLLCRPCWRVRVLGSERAKASVIRASELP